MNESPDFAAFLSAERAALNRAIRFVMVVLVLAADYLNILLASRIGMFRPLFAWLLNGKPLPALTERVITAQPLLLALSLFVPCVAIGACFIPRLSTALYVYGSVILLVFFQLATTLTLLLLPFITFSQPLQGSRPNNGFVPSVPGASASSPST